MIEAKSDYNYNYKTDFQIWRENKEFKRQNISMSLPPLDLTPVGTKMPDTKSSPLDLTPVGAKMVDPKTLTLPTYFSKRNGKAQK